MRFFRLDPLGDTEHQEYCFTDNEPDPIDSYDLEIGVRVADEYPAGFDEVTLQLGAGHPGLELPSFIGNTDHMLIVSREAAGIIRSHDVGEVEEIPFKLVDHGGRVHSEDYVFLNPIGTHDCLDMDRTVCKRHDDGAIMKITRFVLSGAKLRRGSCPRLLRPREAPREYFFAEALVAALRNAGCTNFVFAELDQS